MDDYRFFKRLFRHEFIFDDQQDDLLDVNDILTYLHDRGVISLKPVAEGTWLEIKGQGRYLLQHFAGLIANYFESYRVVIRGCAYPAERTPFPSAYG